MSRGPGQRGGADADAAAHVEHLPSLGHMAELVARFGEPYEAYRRVTPFLVPRLPKGP